MPNFDYERYIEETIERMRKRQEAMMASGKPPPEPEPEFKVESAAFQETFADAEALPSAAAGVPIVKRWVSRVINREPGGLVYLWGDSNRGKTTTARAAMRAAGCNGWGYLDWDDVTARDRRTWRAIRGQHLWFNLESNQFGEWAKLAPTCTVLLLDDLGAGLDQWGRCIAWLDGLIRSRWQAQLYTIITSNWSPEQCAKQCSRLWAAIERQPMRSVEFRDV